MKKKFSNSWVSSSQPRKQRKYRANAPMHKRRRLMGAHLSKELREKYKKRSVPLRKGDKVKVLRGEFTDKIGKVEEVMLNRYKVYIEGVEVSKGEGQASKRPIDPSNVVIIDLDTSDKLRMEAINRK